MEKYSAEDTSAVKQDKKNVLLTGKDPNLSHLFGEEPKTPSGVPTTDVSGQSVMEDSDQFHKDESGEPEYRLFEEQSYVPDFPPANQMILDSSFPSTTETTGPSTSKTGKNLSQRKLAARGNGGSAKVKPFPCKEPGCRKSFCNFKVLQKHMQRIHSNDTNNNSRTVTQKIPDTTKRVKLPSESGVTSTQDMTSTAVQQVSPTVEQPANYSKRTSILSSVSSPGCFNGPAASVTVDANSVRGDNVESKVNDAGFVEGGNANLFNTQLLAQSTSQNVLQNQQLQPETGTQQAAPIFRPHQSSRALQQIAMGVQMRSSQYSAPQQAISTMTSTTIPTASGKQQFMSMQGPITGVRAQLRKSLSSNGKLENVNAMCREWPRVQIPIGGSLDSGMSQNFFQMRMQEENNPSDIDNAPLLKNLLATTKTRRATSSGEGTFAQENGQQSTNTGCGYPPLLNNWAPEPQPQGDLRSPILVAKRNEFQYHMTMSDIPKLDQSPNPSPLHSPTYANTPQFTMQQHSQTTPLSQHSEQQFFPDDIMVSNDNNQQMEESSNESLNEMIIESESLVQDLIDEAEASSNHGQVQQQQLIPYGDESQTMNPTGRVTPPPAYNLDPNAAVMNAELIQNDASNQAMQMYMSQNQVKAEPQSPMIMSPMAQRSFFSNQGNAIGVLPTGNMQPLASPTTPHHQVPLQPGMQPHTPVGEAQWQFPISGQNQNYGSVPQSPVTLVAPINMVQLSGQPTQDDIVQNMNYLPPSRQTATGNPKTARIRRSSSGAARKNPDGTLSCAICDHSFRSVPALNGHMRVHSSSADKKNKDEKQRKGSGSSTGGNESRTPQSLSSPTTPTFNKINPSASMYQNTAAYNSVTVPAYTNPSVLYNPTPSTMDVNPRDRINPQAGLYPYALSHPGPMQPHDALLAAADLIARSEPEFAMFMRSPGRDDFSRTGGDLGQPPNLQHYLGPQQGGGVNTELSAAYRNTPTSGVILVTHPQNLGVPSYMVRQTDGVQTSGTPLVPFVPLQAQGIPGTRQFYTNSPLQEQNQSNPSALDTIQYIQQPSNRSTPLADFADIVVLHDQGQLFTNSQMLAAPFGVAHNHQTREDIQQIQHQSHRQQGEQIQLLDSAADVGMLGSVKNYLWAPESQQHHANMVKVEESVPIIKEENFLSSSMSQLQKSERQVNHQNPSDPFIFPVTVPVQYLRDESPAVTSTFHSIFRQNHSDAFSHNMSAFHDDPLVQESINVANPSTILPNSMMGGDPSGFRSFRQRHHSEGSILKKTWQSESPNKDDMKPCIKIDMSSSMLPGARTPPGTLYSTLVVTGQNSQVLACNKRKVENRSPKPDHDNKRIKTENRAAAQPLQVVAVSQVADTKKEVWTVPKSAPPNRQRHRRHSADSRLTYRSGTLFSRSAYLQSMQMASKGLPGRGTRGTGDSRVKRRPPPLIIPASVNTLGNAAYHNGSLYISQLHQRRRPSLDSGSSCGNEKIPPYTPPPMLSPARFGTGLYRNTPGTPLLKPMMFRQVSCEHTIITTIPEEEPEDDFVRSADPKINIGADYQAELPNMCPLRRLKGEAHKAELVWKPMQEIQTDNSTQSRHVEEYLKLACSAAVPYGGCNKDFALHLLYENKGDILACVRKLLRTKVTVPFDHWMASYTYIGSVRWSLKERQDFERAMMQCHKDFYRISKLVETKTTAECVDYYYHTIKRRRRRIQRPRRFRRDSEEENTSFSHSLNDMEERYSDENDFLHDHVPIRREPEILIQEEERERKTSEVVRRSPPSTAFIRAPPQVNRVASVISQPTPPSVIGFNSAAAQHIPQMHSYAKQPINIQTIRHQATPPPLICNFSQHPITCKVLNCNQIFQTMQQLLQHQQTHKTLKPYFDCLNQATPSPASSTGSVNSAETEAPQFQCPRCGKTFSKVKSRNAHMKTHGKLAQEKRRQKEEEARRKMEEAATWRNRSHHIVISPSGKARKLIQFQTVQSPLSKPPGM